MNRKIVADTGLISACCGSVMLLIYGIALMVGHIHRHIETDGWVDTWHVHQHYFLGSFVVVASIGLFILSWILCEQFRQAKKEG